MSSHLHTKQFFVSMHNILNDHGSVSTNANLFTTDAFCQLSQVLSSTFEMNIVLAHDNITEHVRIVISGSRQTLLSIASCDQAVQEAQRLQSDAHFEFNMSRLISLAYQGPLIENTSST